MQIVCSLVLLDFKKKMVQPIGSQFYHVRVREKGADNCVCGHDCPCSPNSVTHMRFNMIHHHIICRIM